MRYSTLILAVRITTSPHFAISSRWNAPNCSITSPVGAERIAHPTRTAHSDSREPPRLGRHCASGAAQLARVGRPSDRVADAEWHGVDQHEGDARPLGAAIGPGVIGAALDHDIAGLELHGRGVHVHLDFAL